VRAIDGGRHSLRFAIKVAFDKYVAHLLLERQTRLMAHHGLNVTSQTLWDQCSAVTELLRRTYDALFAELRASPVVGVDQTGWPDLEEGSTHPAAKRGSPPPAEAGRTVWGRAILILTLKVALTDIKPVIWRRVRVPGALTLRELHEIIQVAMGWENAHLHSFTIDDEKYGQPDPMFGGVKNDTASPWKRWQGRGS